VFGWSGWIDNAEKCKDRSRSLREDNKKINNSIGRNTTDNSNGDNTTDNGNGRFL
jgi:hypothetical protein